MRWIKRGLIFCPAADFGWMNSHAQIPTALDLGDRLRIYFSSRREPRLSLTGFLDVDARNPGRVLHVHDKPVLEPGPAGAFDEHGVMPQYVCENEGQIWLYYSGWSRRVEIPYSNWTGLAVSEDGGVTFRKMFPGPIIDRTPHELYSATGTYILRRGADWHLWYASGVDWIEEEGKKEEHYVIKYASSDDGIYWKRENRQLLDSKDDDVKPTHRPSVFEMDGTYHMLFCYRGIRDFRDGENAYRIGYASSPDLRNWTRDDARAGLERSDSGWDSKATAYPYILCTEEKTLLFYCGNGFGASGFGYAELEA